MEYNKSSDSANIRNSGPAERIDCRHCGGVWRIDKKRPVNGVASQLIRRNKTKNP